MRRERSTVLGRVDAFLAHAERFSDQELRDWLPEIEQLRAAVRELYERGNPNGTHTRPDPELARRLFGLTWLVGRAVPIQVQATVEQTESGDWALRPVDDPDSEPWVLYGLDEDGEP